MMSRHWLKTGVTASLLAMSLSVQAATILVFGDSISAAYGLGTEQGWVQLLQQKLDKTTAEKHQVINGSLSGETTAGGVKRLPPLLQKHRPALVILELGANDGLRGHSPELIESNLRHMVAVSQESGARVIVLGMKIPPNYGKAYRQEFANGFITVSKEKKVPLMPFFLDGIGGHPELMQQDGIHPTAAAQQRLLDNAWPVIAKELKHL